MILGDQRPGSENLAGLEDFVVAAVVPIELHPAREQTEHAVARFASPEDQGVGLHVDHLPLAGKGAHGVESVHRRDRGKGAGREGLGGGR